MQDCAGLIHAKLPHDQGCSVPGEYAFPDYTEGDATCRVAVGRVISAASVHCARRGQPEPLLCLFGKQFERADGSVPEERADQIRAPRAPYPGDPRDALPAEISLRPVCHPHTLLGVPVPYLRQVAQGRLGEGNRNFRHMANSAPSDALLPRSTLHALPLYQPGLPQPPA